MTSSASSYRPHIIREDFLDFVLGRVNPLWSIRQPKGTITAIETLPDQMVRLTIKPNRHVGRWQSGQFVLLGIQLEGRWQQRAYSIVSLPDQPLQIAIKKQGKVSRYLAEQAQIGEVLLLSQPAGEFTLPDQPQPLLLIASGSGITPMLPLLQTALRATDLPVTLMYFSRDPAFLPELEQFRQQYAHFDLQVYASAEASSRLLDIAFLQRQVPDIGQRLTYVCANPALMQLTRDIWQQQGWADRLIQESFLPIRIDTQASRQPVRLRRAMRDIEAQGNLLASAEANGLQPASGCRMGICNTCVCTRVSGSTRNLLTGEITSAPNQPIRLCISEAVSPVELDL